MRLGYWAVMLMLVMFVMHMSMMLGEMHPQPHGHESARNHEFQRNRDDRTDEGRNEKQAPGKRPTGLAIAVEDGRLAWMPRSNYFNNSPKRVQDIGEGLPRAWLSEENDRSKLDAPRAAPCRPLSRA